MLRLGSLGLNQDSWHLSTVCMNDAAMRQVDVNVRRSNLARVAEIEDRTPVLDVLLQRNSTAKTWRLAPSINVDLAPKFHAHAKT
ncbi:MAG TPA: hypothetical protein VFA58_04940 [Chthoniobacterales bacterium]|nr:hypothetical protein [Chthoniobacterales bacterium]